MITGNAQKFLSFSQVMQFLTLFQFIPYKNYP